MKILEKTKTIVSDSKTLLDRIKTMYSSFSSKLPENIIKAIQGAQQRYNTSQQIVSGEATVPGITNQQFVTIAENFRFLSNIHDFVKQSIRKSVVKTHFTISMEEFKLIRQNRAH